MSIKTVFIFISITVFLALIPLTWYLVERSRPINYAWCYWGADLKIFEVIPNGSAQRAGIRKGDVVVAINQQPVADVRSAERLLQRVQPGDSIGYQIRRDHHIHNFKLIISAFHPVFNFMIIKPSSGLPAMNVNIQFRQRKGGFW